jgi:hypothetical protein
MPTTDRRRIGALVDECAALGIAPRAPTVPAQKQTGAVRRYLAALRSVRAARGEHCEACGAPTRYAHHVNPVSATGLASALVWHEANLLLLCNDCHALMHPGVRSYPWFAVGRGRMRALAST